MNFITCHDGFTLADLVSYDAKRNEANQQGNQDGTDDNRSWNCGSGPGDDGPTAGPEIATLRRRQQRNLLTTLLISHGVPMLQAGDERNRTQQGNNNAYCQDNAISWTGDTAANNLTAVVRKLVALRSGDVPALRAPRFPEPGSADPSAPVADAGLAWFNPDGSPAAGRDWDNTQGHSFTILFAGETPAPSALALINGFWEPLTFVLPGPPAGTWTVRLDTTQEDGTPTTQVALSAGTSIELGPRAIVIATG